LFFQAVGYFYQKQQLLILIKMTRGNIIIPPALPAGWIVTFVCFSAKPGTSPRKPPPAPAENGYDFQSTIK
jgi:hypothetical protein